MRQRTQGTGALRCRDDLLRRSDRRGSRAISRHLRSECPSDSSSRHSAAPQLHGSRRMTMPRGIGRECAIPIDAAVLMDYWLAALSPEQEDVVEQHLMTCDQCGDRLREIIALADSLRVLARSG